MMASAQRARIGPEKKQKRNWVFAVHSGNVASVLLRVVWRRMLNVPICEPHETATLMLGFVNHMNVFDIFSTNQNC